MGYLTFQILRVCEFVLLAAGAQLAISVGGIFFFGFMVPYLAAPYIFAICAQSGLSFSLSLSAALAGALVLGGFFTILYRRLSHDGFAVFTIASILGFDALLRSWDSVTGGVLGITAIPRPAFVNSLGDLVPLAVIATVLVLLLYYFLVHSRFGFALRAHKENRSLLDATGVSSTRIGVYSILLTSFLCAVSGMIGIWRLQYLDPSFGDIRYFIVILTACVLAFKPKVSWLFASAAFVALLPELLRFFPFPSAVLGHLRALTYAILLILVIFRLSAQNKIQRRLL